MMPGSRWMAFPLIWCIVIPISGVGADRVRLSLGYASLLTIGTLLSIGILAYDIRREAGWAAKSLPAVLLLFLALNLLVLWYWNV